MSITARTQPNTSSNLEQSSSSFFSIYTIPDLFITHYSNPSFHRRAGGIKLVVQAINTISAATSKHRKTTIGIAELGCCSGPNALSVVSHVLETIYNKHRESSFVTPEILVFLNDLPSNDFNSLFKDVGSFCDELRRTKGDSFGPCFVAGMPGTFYGRLFPSDTLHIVHSSYGLHWLSQVPEGIEKTNKGNFYIAKSSPPSVITAYLNQFKKDLTVFLECRSEELVSGGRMVLTLVGRSSLEDPTSKECCSVWELREGSFRVNQLETFHVNWDGSDPKEDEDSVIDNLSGAYHIANVFRATSKPLLANHFGKEVMDKLFGRCRERIAEYATTEKTVFANLVISMTKTAILITRPIVEEAILNILSKLYNTTTISAATSKLRKTTIGIAELGCSSGPNALLVVSYILDCIYNRHCQSGSATPEILVFLNDLPGNDFNTLFKDVGGFCDELRRTTGDGFGPCFVSGTPGTFYGRLFPSDTLHIVHSSYSLMWLSQVPHGIDKTNKGNFYIAKSSPPSVLTAYLNQFKKNFRVFLECRSEELINGGKMVLTVVGRSSSDPTSKECCSFWKLLALSAHDLVLKVKKHLHGYTHMQQKVGTYI
ncbi:hypothetical protein C5167_020168 [Papaver somniferum]|uniref:Jasmonate O-methyltransferase n=1 Tax=Papaver somniferum TaxID=3469 RepID=A0A4Y7IS90_PAPSO|nr:hypothetical protein C5167_020168 [Papaver somniferum]